MSFKFPKSLTAGLVASLLVLSTAAYAIAVGYSGVFWIYANSAIACQNMANRSGMNIHNDAGTSITVTTTGCYWKPQDDGSFHCECNATVTGVQTNNGGGGMWSR